MVTMLGSMIFSVIANSPWSLIAWLKRVFARRKRRKKVAREGSFFWPVQAVMSSLMADRCRYCDDFDFFFLSTPIIISTAMNQSGTIGLAPRPVRGFFCSACKKVGKASLTNDSRSLPPLRVFPILGISCG